MYNKIASIILNLAKVQGSGIVYVSQPDAEKESAVGKLFLLAEMGGKKAEMGKFLEFLISELEENYYQDDKVMLIGKVDGLKPENIFEAAIAKTNKSINEYLRDHKIKLEPSGTNVTLGVVCGTKLHFTSFGKNRALLIYRREDGYEIVNVEDDAKNAEEDKDSKDKKTAKSNNLFSSVISGVVPVGSYFVFASESLPEYLSSRELVKIITKLPPIVAAEQIKNILSRINNYVPYLGIIIKNTTDNSGREIEDINRPVPSAQSSISSLNSTEKTTESMLSPAGLISMSKAGTILKNVFKSDTKNKKVSEIKPNTERPTEVIPASRTSTDRSKLLNLPGANSFLRPHKVRLKKGSRRFFSNFKQFLFFIPRLFSPSFWKGFVFSISSWFKSLNKKHAFMLGGLVIVVIAFVISLTIMSNVRNNREQEQAYNLAVIEIEEKETLIDSYLLYNNKEGASKVLADLKDLINDLPKNTEEQTQTYEEFSGRLSVIEDRILDIERIDEVEELADYSDLNIDTIVLAGEDFYANSENAVYSLDIETGESEEIETEAQSLGDGRYYDDNNSLFYRDGGEALIINTNTGTSRTATLSNFEASESHTGFDIFNNSMYLVSPSQDQIYVYPSHFSTRRNWMLETVDLAETVDIFIDGNIFLLQRDGSVTKYFQGREQDYQSTALQPNTLNATKMLGNDDYLFILADSNRLIVLDKNEGTQLQQHLFNTISIDDFAISEDNTEAYLLSEGKIYLFPLSLVTE